MCRMFGFRSSVPSRAHRSLVVAENALADQSRQHPDGWGIGWFQEDEPYVLKSANAAHASQRFEAISARLTSHTFIVHVRRATVGLVDSMNAHPFRHGRWIFAHNGTVFQFDAFLRQWVLDRIDASLYPLIHGDTDSEHLFHFLLTRLGEAGVDLNGRGQTNATTVAQVMRSTAMELDLVAQNEGIGRPILNLLLTDGRLMVAHKAGMPLFLSTQKRFCADFETCHAVKVCMERVRPMDHPVNHLLIASERIATEENLWEEVPDGATVMLDASFHLRTEGPPAGWVAPVLPAHLRVSP